MIVALWVLSVIASLALGGLWARWTMELVELSELFFGRAWAMLVFFASVAVLVAVLVLASAVQLAFD